MNQLDLLPLSAPTTPLRFPQEPILREASIQDNYRWTATRAWGAGPCISWTLFNPSDADAKRDDPTMWRMMGFSYRWGFGSMIVTNVYPFIASQPAALRKWRESWRREDVANDGGNYEHNKSALNAWLHNLDIVQASLKKSQTHVAAWGNGPDAGDLEEFIDNVTWEWDTIGTARYRCTGDDGLRIKIDWMCLGITGLGAPKHPLARGLHRVPDDATLQVWRKAA